MHPYLRNKRKQKCSQKTRKVDRKEKQWSVTTVEEGRMFPEEKIKILYNSRKSRELKWNPQWRGRQWA